MRFDLFWCNPEYSLEDAIDVRAREPRTPIASGALVLATIDDETTKVVFVMPCAGGSILSVDGIDVAVITPSSPVGAALVGKEEGDVVEIATRGAVREWTIERVE